MLRVYLDSNVYIYLFDGHPDFGPLARHVVSRLLQSGAIIVSSTFCLGEVLVRPVRLEQEFNIARIARFFRLPGVLMVNLQADAALHYAELRSIHRIKSLDALHLACAAQAQCDLFLTNDTRLLNLEIPGIGLVAGLDHQFAEV